MSQSCWGQATMTFMTTFYAEHHNDDIDDDDVEHDNDDDVEGDVDSNDINDLVTENCGAIRSRRNRRKVKSHSFKFAQNFLALF